MPRRIGDAIAAAAVALGWMVAGAERGDGTIGALADVTWAEILVRLAALAGCALGAWWALRQWRREGGAR